MTPAKTRDDEGVDVRSSATRPPYTTALIAGEASELRVGVSNGCQTDARNESVQVKGAAGSPDCFGARPRANLPQQYSDIGAQSTKIPDICIWHGRCSKSSSNDFTTTSINSNEKIPWQVYSKD